MFSKGKIFRYLYFFFKFEIIQNYSVYIYLIAYVFFIIKKFLIFDPINKILFFYYWLLVKTFWTKIMMSLLFLGLDIK